MQTELKEKINFLIETSQIGVSKDFTAEEKKLVFDHFEQFGLTTATCRNRFFRDGWHQWELDGIIQCLIDYADEHPEVQGFAEECRKFTLESDVTDIQSIASAYYSAIGVKRHFLDFMEARGFSHTSCVSHFNNTVLFYPWELHGIKRIFAAFNS